MISRTLIIEALGYKRNKAFGYQEYLFNLLTYFSDNRTKLLYNKIVIACDSTQCNDFHKYSDIFAIKGFNTPSLLYRLITQFFLPFLLRLKKTDTILYTGNYSSLIKKSKHVLVIHDLLYLRKSLMPDFLIRLQRRIYMPRSIALSDNIVAISEFTKNDILRNFKTSSGTKIVRIYNYFNFEKYSATPFLKDKASTHKYFLCISSSAFHKNTITVLKAYEKYCFHNSENELYLVGSLVSGSALIYYNQLDIRVKDKIHVLSNISNQELAELYSDCEAYVSASFFEGLGMPIVEAMFFNAPLILSDLEICREVTNSQAVFFDPYSFEDLFQILINFKPEIVDTRSFVLEKYSSLNTSQKYIDLLN